MSHGFRARTNVAVVGFAHSQVQRDSAHPLGVIALETVLRAIADAGLTTEQLGGFTTRSLLPSR